VIKALKGRIRSSKLKKIGMAPKTGFFQVILEKNENVP